MLQRYVGMNLLGIEIKKLILMNKPGYLKLLLLELRKILMYQFWYDLAEPKYGKKIKFVLHGYK